MNTHVDWQGASCSHANATSSSNPRAAPSRWQYDYLVLSLLHRDIVRALSSLHQDNVSPKVAIDVGAGGGPYRHLLGRHGYTVKTLDIAPGDGIDIVGSAEHTGLANDSVDLVLCTQVLEHTRTPWLAMREFGRILRPGGNVLISAPHVWFYHPHPGDFWRMTSEGLVALCDEGGLEVSFVQPQGGSAAALFQVLNFLAYGVMGRGGAPIYGILNWLGSMADGVVRDTRFAMNHLCVASKRAPNSARFSQPVKDSQ